MISLAALRELYVYNYWARDCQLEVCAVLTQEQFERPLGNSFPSVRDTFTHMVSAEWVWLERFRGRSPQAQLPAEEFPDLAAVATRWKLVEEGVNAYLESLRKESLSQPLTYVNMRGQSWTYPLWRALLHLVNHQTYHRGQITMLLRQLGIRPAPVDLLIADDMGVFDKQREATLVRG